MKKIYTIKAIEIKEVWSTQLNLAQWMPSFEKLNYLHQYFIW